MSALLSLFLSGCVTTSGFWTAKDRPPTGDVCSVAVCWDKQIAFVPDPVNGGKATPTLLGCLYVYTTQSTNFPVHADGTVIVDLYDPAHAGSGGGPVLLEEWRIDRDMLKRLEKHDFVGDCYTLVLPWGTYRPDLLHVELKLRFESGKGLPVYASSAPLSLTIDRIDLKSSTRLETPQGLPTSAAAPR